MTKEKDFEPQGAELWAGKYLWALMEDKDYSVVCYADLG